ncbi:type IX secretion system protein PorD [Winogradskyella immobilis]|uniref:DUF4835 family protein n=1 Tax=Winogradskyella immobilis TaxID=2816852 RepID=A0ABS8EP50_9FLAO|nr:DUF4835 family protein [Winogradskyella immobilis]MCC1484802.1 DUF4835 family protein [Winogradskyella immobilis]MCG0016894.1 DUF4835 family protein [Winogradskyella immobilis]
MRKLTLLFVLLLTSVISAQELNCTVTVVAQQTGNDNNVVFRTLERQLTEFINNTQWTNKKFSPQERINCSFVINVLNHSNDAFSTTLQIQSSRPIFNSSYSSTTYAFNDEDFDFQYLEFQNLVFNPNQFESNLVSVLTFHIYMILGLDADSFKLNGGDEYYRIAQTITNYSQQGNVAGWRLEDGLQSRFALIDNILSPTFKEFRTAFYNYHLKGLDIMNSSPKKGKEEISKVVNELQPMHNRRPNSFLMRVFFDAKANEIADIFKGGPSINITQTVDLLNRIAPLHSSKWRQIKF